MFVRLSVVALLSALAVPLEAQPVFTVADFGLRAQPHVRASQGAARPDTLAPLLALRGGPHVFSVAAAGWGPVSEEVNTPVACQPLLPGCQDVHLAGASLVVEARQGAEALYRFQDLESDGLFSRGWAGTSVGAAGVPVEGRLVYSPPEQVLAFPLSEGSQWHVQGRAHLVVAGVEVEAAPVACTRAVVAWGVLRLESLDVPGLLVRSACATWAGSTAQPDTVAPDSARAFSFVSPTHQLAADVDGAGRVRSALLDTYGAVPTARGDEHMALGLAVLNTPRPNPSRGAVALTFSLSAPGRVQLDVYDALGRRVAVAASGFFQPGTHAVVWAASVPQGVYAVRLEAGGQRQTRLLVRVE